MIIEANKVPESFSDLSPEEYHRLHGVLTEHFRDVSNRGCRTIFDPLIPSRRRIINGRIEELTTLAKMPDQKSTTKLLTGVSLITAGSNNTEEAMQRVQEGYLKGTHGGQSTGVLKGDQYST